ncbi:MAG TPA: xanthine dehydrogenase family protein molybdopterin-binding subunit, partial [Thermoanaerobaculia bacterium]|nr:xanthine dehydrogenase family protein molybdopterin-binding subunit [Thermoanaerobaculia bacterium]
MSVLGQAIKRREDPALITGKGKYTDDLQVAGMTYAAIVRSPHGHARIRAIRTGAAQAAPGVVAVYTGQDLLAKMPGKIPVGWLLPGIKTPDHLAMATDSVRYVGHAVAVVVAEDRYAA